MKGVFNYAYGIFFYCLYVVCTHLNCLNICFCKEVDKSTQTVILRLNLLNCELIVVIRLNTVMLSF